MTKVGKYLLCVLEAPLADIESFDFLAHKLIRIVGRIPCPTENISKNDMVYPLVRDRFRRGVLC